MIFRRHFISILGILLFSVCARAQETDTDTGFVYRDTSIVTITPAEKNVDEEVEDTVSEENDSSAYVADTTLRYNELTIDADSVRILKNMKSFAYAKVLDSLLKDYQQKQQQQLKKPAKQESSWLIDFFSSNITKYVFWVVAIAFIVFILSRLFFADGFFQRSYKKSPVKIIEDTADNLTQTTDYTKLLTQAISQKNYRLAIRYYYLQVLQKLSSKGVIALAPDKTNNEYVRELTGKSYKKEFASLTLLYEYAWYGEFDTDEAIFESVQQKFKQFNTVL